TRRRHAGAAHAAHHCGARRLGARAFRRTLMRLDIRFIAFSLLALAGATPALAFDAGAVAAARRDLQTAVNRSDAGAVQAVRARLVALAAAEPGATRVQLWIATAAWRAVPLLMQKDPKRAEQLGDDALARLEKVLAADTKNAEAL